MKAQIASALASLGWVVLGAHERCVDHCMCGIGCIGAACGRSEEKRGARSIDRTSDKDTRRSYRVAKDCGHHRSVQSVLGLVSTGLATSATGAGLAAAGTAMAAAAAGKGGGEW